MKQECYSFRVVLGQIKVMRKIFLVFCLTGRILGFTLNLFIFSIALADGIKGIINFESAASMIVASLLLNVIFTVSVNEAAVVSHGVGKLAATVLLLIAALVLSNTIVLVELSAGTLISWKQEAPYLAVGTLVWVSLIIAHLWVRALRFSHQNIGICKDCVFQGNTKYLLCAVNPNEAQKIIEGISNDCKDYEKK